jgi:uncharacterized membrane protein SirB2
MDAFEIARTIHVAAVYCSLAGFILRGYWMLSDSVLFRARATRVVPHCIDTLLLGSAIVMLSIWQVSPFQLPWLMAKLVALLVYIGLGMVAFRFGRDRRSRSLAWLGSIAVFIYMLGVAQNKSPASWWVLLAA